MEELVQELENASQMLLAPPNLVTAEQRHAAENVFINFQKSRMPYEFCRHILETCKNDYVLFQAASTVKQSVVREWSLLKPGDIESLRTFLLHYVTQNIGLQSYVREQILQAVAVMFKRGTVDSEMNNRDSLFADVTQLIQSGNLSMQLVACSILTALLNEYSSTNKSSSVGLTWEFHSRCKIAFEQTDLKKVFMFCLQVLHELEKTPNPLDREVTTVFNRFLNIMEQILGWDFMPKNIPRKLVGSFLHSQNVSFKPPSTWKDVILDKAFIQMMFRIHLKVRYNSELAHHSLQCLAQLASLNGHIFGDDKTRVEYLSHYIHTFLDLLMHSPAQDYEALGIANIMSSLVMFYPTSIFILLQNETLSKFLQNLTKLTCNFCQAAAQEEAMHKDDTLFMEAYEKTLDAYMTFINNSCDLPSGALVQHAIEIFNTYLQCHLSPPDGNRQDALPEGADEEEYEEDEQEDREKFKDQLTCVGAFGRHVPQHSIPLLTRLLEDRVGRLNAQLQRIKQHSLSLSPGGPTSSPVDVPLMTGLSEDLHWLLLVSTNLLTDPAEGETPMIPSDVMTYSISLSKKVDIQTTLKVLASPGEQASSIPGADVGTDVVVRLISSVFRLCEVEKRAIDYNMSGYLSPQVGSSIMYFLGRWVQSYLLPEETYYSQMSMSLASAFGRDTEGGQWTVSYLVDKICTNLSAFGSEPALVSDTVNMLVSLVENSERSNYVAKCDSLWKLAKEFASGHSSLETLPGTAKRELCKGLVMAASSTFSGQEKNKEHFWQINMQTHTTETGHCNLSLTSKGVPQLDPTNMTLQSHPGLALCLEVLNSQHTRFKAVVSLPTLKKNFHEESVKREVLSLLDSMCGVAEATRVDSVTLLFSFLHPALVESVNILDLFHNYEEVVQMVLELFSTVANRQICYLGVPDTQKMYKVSLSMVQMYAKHNSGRIIVAKDAEEDQFSDLLTLMEMLTNLLSKDFIDFGVSEDSASGGDSVSAADVVLYGLNTLVPLMTVELLKFPALCTSYMRLLAYIAEIYPEKLCCLSEGLFKSMMASVEIGLTTFGPEIIKLCLEFLTSLGSHVYNNNLTGSYSHQTLVHFLQIIFKMLFLETFDMDLLDTASVTFFTLVCCHQVVYQQLVSELLGTPREETQQQRLVVAFHTLSPAGGVQWVLDRPNRLRFMQNFDKFLVNVRGFLCVK